VLGSYLDPLADKAFACAAVSGAAAAGVLPLWLAGAVVARDAGLVAGAVAARAAAAGWAWPGGPEFFRLVEGEADRAVGERRRQGGDEEARAGGGATPSSPPSSLPPAPAVRPLAVSKVNTALQFVTLAAALAGPALGWPDERVVEGLAAATLATTAASAGAYGVQWVRGARG
jgi:cardiolipin synthase